MEFKFISCDHGCRHCICTVVKFLVDPPITVIIDACGFVMDPVVKNSTMEWNTFAEFFEFIDGGGLTDCDDKKFTLLPHEDWPVPTLEFDEGKALLSAADICLIINYDEFKEIFA